MTRGVYEMETTRIIGHTKLQSKLDESLVKQLAMSETTTKWYGICTFIDRPIYSCATIHEFK